MKAYSTAALDAMRDGAIVKRGMIKFVMPSGTYAFWDGLEPFTPSGSNVDADASGVVFQAGGSLFEIECGAIGTSGEEPQITVKLRALPLEKDAAGNYVAINGDHLVVDGDPITVGAELLTPDVLATIFDEHYVGAKVSIFRALFNPNTGALLDVALRRRGRIKSISMIEQISDDGAGIIYLQASIHSRMIEWDRRGAHDRCHESQSLTFPGDVGLNRLSSKSFARRWGKGVTE